MLRLSSPAFQHGGMIPSKFTCDGGDVSPALNWSGAPAGSRSLALIVDDPDAPDPAAPKRVWVHWVLYNLPLSSGGLVEGAGSTSIAGARDALNDWNRPGYGGPCPPIGRHRYFHKLYALDRELPDLGPQARKADVERAMEGHILERAELIGTYQR